MNTTSENTGLTPTMTCDVTFVQPQKRWPDALIMRDSAGNFVAKIEPPMLTVAMPYQIEEIFK